jgi:kynureninase
MLVSFYRPVGKRKKIVIESKAFPSDQYAVDSFIKLLGHHPDDILIEVKPKGDNQVLQDEDVIATIQEHSDEIALVFLGGVNYYTGHVFDMNRISKESHASGALVGFDLAHAVGNIELNLHDWGVDFACWCSYKYLNGGPGAVGAVFVHERHHQDSTLNRLTGWWGYKKEERFLMESTFVPEPDATGWQLSTPPIFLFACLKASLSIFEEAGWKNILAKQHKMIDWLKFLIDDITSLEEAHVKCLTPDSRGCQVSLKATRKPYNRFRMPALMSLIAMRWMKHEPS